MELSIHGSYLSDLKLDTECFFSPLYDLWLLQKCEIEYMSISILPYDNISNWSDLGGLGGRALHTQQLRMKESGGVQNRVSLLTVCISGGGFSQSSLAPWVFFPQFICLSLCDYRLKDCYIILSYESKELNGYSGVCDLGRLLVDVLG